MTRFLLVVAHDLTSADLEVVDWLLKGHIPGTGLTYNWLQFAVMGAYDFILGFRFLLEHPDRRNNHIPLWARVKWRLPFCKERVLSGCPIA